MSFLRIFAKNALCVIVAIPLAILWLWLGCVIAFATSEWLLVLILYVLTTAVLLASLAEWSSSPPSPSQPFPERGDPSHADPS